MMNGDMMWAMGLVWASRRVDYVSGEVSLHRWKTQEQHHSTESRSDARMP